ncbi:aminotransferase class V-fold PLP-dependent enzyme [Saccharopolyspora sp. ID03-671]|uniref:aminotransferase class V-fold PLP-dependent enzyme n=1 Tax=Saccharopolyspora sp. ID03-671 TaxID=3073066 RepID=UPI00324CAF33
MVGAIGTLVPALAASPVRAASPLAPAPSKDKTPGEIAKDERYWRNVAEQFNVTNDFINLENGYYGIMPDAVRQTFHSNVDLLNSRNSRLLRTTYKSEADKIRQRIADLLGAQQGEIALTQSGTEALQNLIGGYNELRPGDAVMYADLDYPDMQNSMDWLKDRRGVKVVTLAIPEPATRQAVLDAYAAAFRDHPAVKLLLLSHVNNRTGLVLPVREIVSMARDHGVDVIVDAAHSWGQLDFTVADLEADFVGFSLHKWIGAPLGTGFLYVRQHRLNAIDPAFADRSYPPDDIRSRVVSGTRDVACVLSVPSALDHHVSLGSTVKHARLQHLRDCWVKAVSDIDNIEILTPEDPSMYSAITSFRITGRISKADNEAISNYLFDRYRIFTVERDGPVKGSCVRVTPALFTLREQVDQLAAALHDAAERFRA